MSNISFDKPLMLLIFIPLLLLILIPFIIAVKKDNLNKKNIISFSIHFVIITLITLALAKINYEVVVTKTNVYALCDVSYSCNDKLNDIDKAVSNIEKKAPKNTEIGVVAFAKEQEIINKPGQKIKSVKNNNISDDETNIKDALLFTADLFDEDVIKRIVIITDGNSTNKENLVSVIENLESENIFVDAIYIDTNLTEETKEIQISDVSYEPKAFLNKNTNAKVLVESTYDTEVIFTIYKNNQKYKDLVFNINKGFNSLSVNLDTKTAGINDYKIEVIDSNDKSNYNNTCIMHQEVVEKANMLFVSGNAKDIDLAERLYGNDYIIDYYINDYKVPYSLDNLCKYDQFVLSNVNITDLNNCSAFISNIDLLVSKYGKNLVTLGNVYVQNNYDDTDLGTLGNMLPIHFGNDDKDNKIVVIVLDISRSMENASHLTMAKLAACNILDMLADDDLVAVIGFYGEIEVIQQPIEASNREAIKAEINSIEAAQGTFMGAALKKAYDILINTNYTNQEVFLISDGLPYGPDEDTARNVATSMANRGISISALNTDCPNGATLMENLCTVTGGNYYQANNEDDLKNVVLAEIADDVTETIVEGENYTVNINSFKHEVMNNITKLPDVNGFYYNTLKVSATKIISTYYETSKKVGNSFVGYDVPLYATWGYGNGNVSSFACDISTWWLNNWNTQESDNFMKNVMSTNIPLTHITSPFIVNVETTGNSTKVTCDPASINGDATLKLELTLPNDELVEYNLVFNSQNYEAIIETSEIGLYDMKFTYQIKDTTYEFYSNFTLSYKNEYDSFESSNINTLYQMVSKNGQVSENLKLEINNNDSYVFTYSYDLIFVFMIIAIILYLIDIIIRKIRLADIKAIFRKGGK